MTAGPDFTSREADELARVFRHFGDVECPQLDAPLYQELCYGIASDPELLALAARTRAGQPPPNLLFAAVHYLLLGGDPHPLRAWYAGLAGADARPPAEAFPVFRDFCLGRRDAVIRLLETRLTQTNVVQRCSVLLPAFAAVSHARGGRPLALVEIGPSAGLNLQWDRFRYEYDDGTRWGPARSRVLVPCELRGEHGLPALPDEIAVSTRCGVDVHPIDVTDPDAVQWLRALVWPEHAGRQERLSAAIEIAREHPPEIRTGDASGLLPGLIGSAPPDAAVCVYGTHTLYQFPPEALRETLRGMQHASRERTVDFLSMEGTGDRCSELRWTRYRDAARETRVVARCSPHGRWLEWLA